MQSDDNLFLTHILSRAIGKQMAPGTKEQSQILVESVLGASVMGSKKWKIAITFTGEPFQRPNYRDYNNVLGWAQAARKLVICPLYTWYLYESRLDLNRPKHVLTMDDITKQKFCCFVIANPRGTVRNGFINRLRQRGLEYHAFGKYLKNQNRDIGENFTPPLLLEAYKEYAFVICFENTVIPNYITEKIVNPILAGTIPVYSGMNNVDKYINPARYLSLDGNDIASMDKLINRMVELYANPTARYEIINTHCYPLHK